MKTKFKQFAAGALALASSVVLAATEPASTTAADQAKTLMEQACEAYKDITTAHLTGIIAADSFKGNFKIQKNYLVDVKLKAPDKFKASWEGDGAGVVLFDGKKIWALDKKTNSYAEVAFTGSFAEMLKTTDKLNLPAPMLDLMEQKSCKEALVNVTQAAVLAPLSMKGVELTHLAFRNEKDQIDWQVWIKKDADRLVIKKILIASNAQTKNPQYEMTILTEELNQPIEDSEFQFVVPAEAKKVELDQAHVHH